MALSRLALTDVRSYAELLLEPSPGLVILTGENGAGKTNVLEAISLLVPGRGLRGAPLGDVARSDGPGAFAVAARLTTGVELGVGTAPAAPERRQVRINGAAAPITALAERLALLWLTPAMDRLFTEGASGRRRFLDRLVLTLEPAHATHSSRYEAAMRARNRLLEEPARADPEWLSAIEAAMAEHGTAIAAARSRTVRLLGMRLATAPIAFLPRPGLALEDWGAHEGGGGEEADDAARFATQLREGRGADARAGRALSGPHRTDLLVTHEDKGQPASRASTGEQKALTLGLVLAHAEAVDERRDQPVVLLLDEVAAHLDPGRRAALFARLSTSGRQVWMTGTEPALFADAPAEAERLHVTPGRVSGGR